MTPLDPESLLERKGLDPALLAFTIQLDDPGGSKLVSGSLVPIYAGQALNTFCFSRGGKIAWLSVSELPEHFKGKGIGSIAYQFLAKDLYNRCGAVLHSQELEPGAPRGLSLQPDAAQLWSRMRQQGLAEIDPDTIAFRWRMVEAVLVRDEVFERVMAFVEKRLGR